MQSRFRGFTATESNLSYLKKHYKGSLLRTKQGSMTWEKTCFSFWAPERAWKQCGSCFHRMWMLPIPLWNCLCIDKCAPINLCHQARQGLKIELCCIELRWSLAQLKQLRLSIRQSIRCTLHGQTFADCCLYLFRALFREIGIGPGFFIFVWSAGTHAWTVHAGKILITEGGPSE